MNGYALLADLTVLLHAGFVAFVALGALVARRRPWLRRLHLAALGYAVVISAARWVCPLTYVEVWLRARAGQAVDGRTFVERLVEPLLYADLPPAAVLAAALAVALLSLAAYYSPRRLGGRADR
jgi:hypothetical protein